MAIELASKPNVVTSDPDFPYGKIKDIPSGTPVNTVVYQDHHQFFARALAKAGMTANGLYDNDVNGYQLYEAMNYWQDAGKTLELFENDMTTVAGTISMPAVRYNKFVVLGRTLDWVVRVVGATTTGQTEMWLPFPAPILAALGGGAFLDNHLGLQTALCDNGTGTYVPMYVKADITTDAVVLSMASGAAFAASAVNFEMTVKFPLIF